MAWHRVVILAPYVAATAVIWAEFSDEMSNVQGRISVTTIGRAWELTAKGLLLAGVAWHGVITINQVIFHLTLTDLPETS